MIAKEQLLEMENELCALFEAHLGVRQPSLRRALKRAGRRLPKRHQRGGALIADALERASHPKLAAQADEAELRRAFEGLKGWLEKIDRAEQKLRARLRLAGTISFNLLVVAALVFALLRYRGFV